MSIACRRRQFWNMREDRCKEHFMLRDCYLNMKFPFCRQENRSVRHLRHTNLYINKIQTHIQRVVSAYTYCFFLNKRK